MKILVTGGCGFIGHNVVKLLESYNHDVQIIDNMTTYGVIAQSTIDYLLNERMKNVTATIHPICITSPSIYTIIKNFNPDVIIHLASFPRQKIFDTDPSLGSRTMIEGLLNLLEASKKYNVSKFVYISSSMVYGDFTDNVKEDALCNPKGQYGILKLAGEWLVKDYTKRYNIVHTIIRPSAVYGPYDVEDRVVGKFILTAIEGGVLKVNGINEELDFTYVKDVVEGIVLASLSDKTNNKTYNITKSESHRLIDAANLIIKIVGKGNIEIRNKDIDLPSRGMLNIDAAKKDFNYNPKVTIEEGFNKYYDWIINSTYWSKK